MTTCARHPNEETRLSCSECGTPVCHRCAVPSPVGQKCPDCAKQSRGALARGKPRQYAKAAVTGLIAAGATGFALALFLSSVRFFGIIASGFAGWAVARAVRWGAEGNAASVFRIGSYVLAVVAVQLAWLFLGRLLPSGFGLFSYLAAIYGANYVWR